MKVRIKFKKTGVMRYVGHLDIMRFFQKAIRRAGIDIAYSTGFSPHQIMSFAAPLGVGHCTEGDYFDIELNLHNGGMDLKQKLNNEMVPGIEILSVRLLPKDAKNAMASIAAAKYRITLKNPNEYSPDFHSIYCEFLSQNTIIRKKQTKKNEITIDIKPHIWELHVTQNQEITMLIDASSSGNIKPLFVVDAMCDYLKHPFFQNQFQVTRLETYYAAKEENKTVYLPLEMAGDEF